MPAFRKDVDRRLMYLVLILILLSTMILAFSQNKIKSISTEYQNKTALLKEMDEELQEVKSTAQVVRRVHNDREALEEKYNDLQYKNQDLSKTNQDLRKQLITANTELQSTKTTLERTDRDLSVLLKRMEEIETELGDNEAEIRVLKKKIDRVCDKLLVAGGEDSNCE